MGFFYKKKEKKRRISLNKDFIVHNLHCVPRMIGEVHRRLYYTFRTRGHPAGQFPGRSPI